MPKIKIKLLFLSLTVYYDGTSNRKPLEVAPFELIK